MAPLFQKGKIIKADRRVQTGGSPAPIPNNNRHLNNSRFRRRLFFALLRPYTSYGLITDTHLHLVVFSPPS